MKCDLSLKYVTFALKVQDTENAQLRTKGDGTEIRSKNLLAGTINARRLKDFSGKLCFDSTCPPLLFLVPYRRITSIWMVIKRPRFPTSHGGRPTFTARPIGPAPILVKVNKINCNKLKESALGVAIKSR